MSQLLEHAMRTISRFSDSFCIIKKSNVIENGEYSKILECIKNNHILMIENQADLNKKVKDESVEKVFISTELQEKYLYLAFIQLGIEYLNKMGEFEDMQIGKKILYTKIQEESDKRSKINNRFSL